MYYLFLNIQYSTKKICISELVRNLQKATYKKIVVNDMSKRNNALTVFFKRLWLRYTNKYFSQKLMHLFTGTKDRKRLPIDILLFAQTVLF